jgi:hypothetical protein
MSTNYQTAAFAGCPASRLTLAPPFGFGARLGALGLVLTALLRGRELLQTLNRRWRKRRTGNGGPGMPPEDHPTSDGIWDDPELWMLIMMH